MKLYAFDETSDQLDLVPLSARRSLDLSGLKLSRASWLGLSLETRRALSAAGAEAQVAVTRVKELCASAVPPAEPLEALADPSADAAPEAVTRVFGEGRPLPPALWASLSALDRYALCKVAARPRSERLAAAYAEIVGASALSTHVGADGQVRMVDVGPKAKSMRRAVAESWVGMGTDAFGRLSGATAGKGDVLATARLAGIMAAKRTPELIPLCHAIALTHVQIDLELDAETQRVHVLSSVETFDRTGVEMEALVAASTAALTIYDMLKAYDRSMEIGPTRLLTKSGGRSGDFTR